MQRHFRDRRFNRGRKDSCEICGMQIEISRTAAAGGGFLGKKAVVRVLAGLLAVSVGGGAAVFVFRQRRKRTGGSGR